MKNFLKDYAGVLAVVAVILAIIAPSFYGSDSLGAGTRFPSGISADSTSPSAGAVRGTTLTITGEAAVQGFTQGGGWTASTTEAATELWTEADLLGANCFVYSGTSVAAAITITLPASTTWITLLPNAGDSRTWFYDPSAYAAATTTTFVAGTGIIMMEPDEGSAFDVVIAGATSMATITFTRRSDTDVYALVMEFSDAD